MKILFVSPSYKPAYIYGGPTVSVSELAETLVASGNSVTVYTTTANGKGELKVQTGKPVVVNGVVVYYFKRQTGDHTHVSIGLWKKLWSTALNYDVVHFQSWWSILILVAAAVCRMRQKKYIISPRGMLSWYSFQNQHNAVKKNLHRLVGRSLLKKSILHATTSLEWNDCMKINPYWTGFVLPNLVRFPPTIPLSKQQPNELLVFGFLSRIDPKKGLEIFFRALSAVSFEFQLKIAGSGAEEYIADLQNLAAKLRIAEKVEWCGWKSSEQKFDFLQAIDVFVLTSYNENFANTVIESLLVGTPVLISREVGLAEYVEENNLGWICDADSESITNSLNTLHRERKKLVSMHKQAPELVQRDFDKNSLAKKYVNAYQKYF